MCGDCGLVRDQAYGSTATTDTLVTAIEILSPVNKRGDGLHLYRAKRKSLLRTDVHLIELDLLRGGERPGWEVKKPPLVCEDIVLVNSAFSGDIRRFEIWPMALDEPLPLCPVPLLPLDADVPLSLGEVLAQVYQRAGALCRHDRLKTPDSIVAATLSDEPGRMATTHNIISTNAVVKQIAVA